MRGTHGPTKRDGTLCVLPWVSVGCAVENGDPHRARRDVRTQAKKFVRRPMPARRARP